VNCWPIEVSPAEIRMLAAEPQRLRKLKDEYRSVTLAVRTEAQVD
jgi:hypothetical protein